jgi:hypothetical protein
MSNRLAVGFTVAGFLLTAALLAISAGNVGLAIPLGILFVIAAVLTVAPKLPFIHAMPWLARRRSRLGSSEWLG